MFFSRLLKLNFSWQKFIMNTVWTKPLFALRLCVYALFVCRLHDGTAKNQNKKRLEQLRTSSNLSLLVQRIFSYINYIRIIANRSGWYVVGSGEILSWVESLSLLIAPNEIPSVNDRLSVIDLLTIIMTGWQTRNKRNYEKLTRKSSSFFLAVSWWWLNAGFCSLTAATHLSDD